MLCGRRAPCRILCLSFNISALLLLCSNISKPCRRYFVYNIKCDRHVLPVYLNVVNGGLMDNAVIEAYLFFPSSLVNGSVLSAVYCWNIASKITQVEFSKTTSIYSHQYTSLGYYWGFFKRFTVVLIVDGSSWSFVIIGPPFFSVWAIFGCCNLGHLLFRSRGWPFLPKLKPFIFSKVHFV